MWRITTDEHDKLYRAFRQKVDKIDSKLSNLQKAEDDYYLTSKYLLGVTQKAYNLFISSGIEEKRQILKLILQNSVLDGRLVKYSLLKPFDTILKYADSQSGLAKWDDFRQADWSEIVDTPDLILQQTRELLQIANA